MIKILTVVGARPQIIKAAAISRAIATKFKNDIHEIIVHTGQHYDHEMSEVFFGELNIPIPHYNLGVGSSTHAKQTSKMIEGIEELYLKEQPDYTVLYGDTNSTLAGAIAASKLNIPVVHIEAGLRSFNRKMPEEINRVVCDHLSTLLFSPTKTGYSNLLNEGFSSEKRACYTAEKPGIFHCGDIMYDNSLYFSTVASGKSDVLTKNSLEKNKYILATLHRNQNTDDPGNLDSIFNALIEISHSSPILLPLHPRTKEKLYSTNHKILLDKINNTKKLKIVPPVSFLDMIELEQNASLIVTDSGGVQKEAYFFNKPCIILRAETEWVEILETGMAKLASSDYEKIVEAFNFFMNKSFDNMPPIFGDGNTAEFICQTLLENHQQRIQ